MLYQKKIWAGEFQIVLNKVTNDINNIPSNFSQLSNLVGLNLSNKSSSLNTEIEF